MLSAYSSACRTQSSNESFSAARTSDGREAGARPVHHTPVPATPTLVPEMFNFPIKLFGPSLRMRVCSTVTQSWPSSKSAAMSEPGSGASAGATCNSSATCCPSRLRASSPKDFNSASCVARNRSASVSSSSPAAFASDSMLKRRTRTRPTRVFAVGRVFSQTARPPNARTRARVCGVAALNSVTPAT